MSDVLCKEEGNQLLQPFTFTSFDPHIRIELIAFFQSLSEIAASIKCAIHWLNLLKALSADASTSMKQRKFSSKQKNYNGMVGAKRCYFCLESRNTSAEGKSSPLAEKKETDEKNHFFQ